MSVNELSFNIVADKLIEQWHGLRSDSISTVNLSFNNVLPWKVICCLFKVVRKILLEQMSNLLSISNKLSVLYIGQVN